MKAREIKTRIKSVKNIAQITKAMKMVAAARLRRFQERLLAGRPYGEEVRGLLRDLAGGERAPDHPLLRPGPPEGRILLLFFTSDRGLCGSFNSNLFRRAEAFIREKTPERTDICALGKKGRDFLAHRRAVTLLEHGVDLSRPGVAQTLALGDEVLRRFLGGTYTEVVLLYTRFLSMSKREIATETLLPIRSGQDHDRRPPAELLFEPSKAAVLQTLLPMAVKSRLWLALLESLASEMAARMLAMENASKNAKDMIGSLTLQYNRARQAGITKELAEIVGGAEALKT